VKKNIKILFLVNQLSFFISHRLPIATKLLDNGFDVVIAYGELGRSDTNLKALEQKGFEIKYIPMCRGKINLLKDLKTCFYIWNFFKIAKPDIVHLITVKPYLYGGIISRLCGVQGVIASVSGLGTLFIRIDLKKKLLHLLLYPFYKFAFNHFNQKVIFQNKNDLKVLIDWGVINPSKIKLLKGSGVKLENFTNLEDHNGISTVCFASRLLRDKGVYEFISAARLIKERGIKARFLIAGDLDIGNFSGLTISNLNKINKEGNVKVIGFQKDIAKLYAKSHIICLPSYREGFPKALVEAAAASRAIVTTDVPGCRDAIIPNVTGLLVPVKNEKKLADAIQWLIEHPKKRILMGRKGRELAEKEFSIEKIVQSHLEIYQQLITKISKVKNKL
jgi:glycosyltransferase involved in cell wall biosynthesis